MRGIEWRLSHQNRPVSSRDLRGAHRPSPHQLTYFRKPTSNRVKPVQTNGKNSFTTPGNPDSKVPKVSCSCRNDAFLRYQQKTKGGGALCSSANRGINKVLTTRTCRNPRLRRHPRKEGARKSVLASNHALVKYTKGYTDMAVTFIHGCILLLPKVSNAILRFRLSLCAVTQSVPLSTLHQRKEPSDEHALATQSFGGKRTRINQ